MKKFLVIGNAWSVIYKELFPQFKNGEFWVGVSHRSIDFILPDGSLKNVNACWFTNLHHGKIHPKLNLTCKYDPSLYPKYENFKDVIEVSRSTKIPYDYDGVMGVPISFLDVWNPDQFELLGMGTGSSWENQKEVLESLGFNPNMKGTGGLGSPILNGKPLYIRVFIRKK